MAEILTNLEMVGQPVDASLEITIHSSFATVFDRISLEEFLTLETAQARDDQAGYSRTGHAGSRVRCVGGVSPAAIAFLMLFPIEA